MIINDPNKKQHPRKFTSRNGIMSIDVGDEEKNSLIENLMHQMFGSSILRHQSHDYDTDRRYEGNVYEIPVDKETGLYSKEGTDTRRYLGEDSMAFGSSVPEQFMRLDAALSAGLAPQDSLSSSDLDSLVKILEQPGQPYGYQRKLDDTDAFGQGGWEEIVKMIEPAKKGLKGLFGRRKK